MRQLIRVIALTGFWIRITPHQFLEICLKDLTGISTFREVMSHSHLVRQTFRYLRLLNPSLFSITFSSRVKCRETETRIPQTSIRTTAKRKRKAFPRKLQTKEFAPVPYNV